MEQKRLAKLSRDLPAWSKLLWATQANETPREQTRLSKSTLPTNQGYVLWRQTHPYDDAPSTQRQSITDYDMCLVCGYHGQKKHTHTLLNSYGLRAAGPLQQFYSLANGGLDLRLLQWRVPVARQPWIDFWYIFQHSKAVDSRSSLLLEHLILLNFSSASSWL